MATPDPRSIPEDLGEFGRIRKDVAGFGKICEDLGGFGRIWEDVAGFGKTWKTCFKIMPADLSGVFADFCSLSGGPKTLEKPFSKELKWF